jgi:hypothetical protein
MTRIEQQALSFAGMHGNRRGEACGKCYVMFSPTTIESPSANRTGLVQQMALLAKYCALGLRIKRVGTVLRAIGPLRDRQHLQRSNTKVSDSLNRSHLVERSRVSRLRLDLIER